MLEQARVGWGPSGRNGGQIVHGCSRDIDVIEASRGAAVAEPLARMKFEGAQIIRERVRTCDIRCDLKDAGIFSATSAARPRNWLRTRRCGSAGGIRPQLLRTFQI